MVVHAEWHKNLIEELVNGCIQAIMANSTNSHIDTFSVPGSFELPFMCTRLAPNYDCVVAIGILIKGDTMHFEYIADAVSKALMNQQFNHGKPVIFGVLTCLTMEQAQKRCGVGPGGHNHGLDWGLAALKMTATPVPERSIGGEGIPLSGEKKRSVSDMEEDSPNKQPAQRKRSLK